MAAREPHIVIVGGGFGGLQAAKTLRKAAARVTLIDRSNHHLFQPLLYQVATSMLEPAQISAPIRSILRKQTNAAVFLAEVVGVDTERSHVLASNSDRQNVPIPYDYLILATGVGPNYFGNDEFAQYAPGLKSLSDAVAVRNKILSAFELAETDEDPSRTGPLLTFVLVGGGPTGVEMAGAIAEMVRITLRRDFRRIDPTTARILLIEHGPRVLGTFAEKLSQAAKARLEGLGVEVRLGVRVEKVDEDGVVVGGERIASKTVIWTAGVAPSPAAQWIGAPTDRAGRVRVESNLSVPDHPEIFVIGDTASLDQDGRPLPGVAQVAMQQGEYVGKLLARRIAGHAPPRPFRYWDKGNMAVVGRGFAVLQAGKVARSGVLAWLIWAVIHLWYLGAEHMRVSVLMQWIWTFLSGGRASRLIIHYECSQDQDGLPVNGAAATADGETTQPAHVTN